MSTSRFHSLHPQRSLSRLRTAFTRSERSPSSSSVSSASPQSSATTASSSDLAGFSFGIDAASVNPFPSFQRLDLADQQPPSASAWTRRPTTSSSRRARPDASNWDSHAYNHVLSAGPRMHSDARRVIRKKKSMAEMEQQEERERIGGELLTLIEPRPGVGVALGGIEEVLEGQA